MVIFELLLLFASDDVANAIIERYPELLPIASDDEANSIIERDTQLLQVAAVKA